MDDCENLFVSIEEILETVTISMLHGGKILLISPEMASLAIWTDCFLRCREGESDDADLDFALKTEMAVACSVTRFFATSLGDLPATFAKFTINIAWKLGAEYTRQAGNTYVGAIAKGFLEQHAPDALGVSEAFVTKAEKR